MVCVRVCVLVLKATRCKIFYSMDHNNLTVHLQYFNKLLASTF